MERDDWRKTGLDDLSIPPDPLFLGPLKCLPRQQSDFSAQCSSVKVATHLKQDLDKRLTSSGPGEGPEF